MKQKAGDIIENGNKPSAGLLSRELGWAEEDVHRCLNALEREGEVSTYSRDVFGVKHRLVGLNR